MFLDRIVRDVPATVPVHWAGRDYGVPIPPDATLPAFLVVEGLADAAARESCCWCCAGSRACWRCSGRSRPITRRCGWSSLPIIFPARPDDGTHPSLFNGTLMVYEVVTALEGAEVLRRAKRFFAERVPMQAAFPEKEGPTYLTLRGQGGEEIAMAVVPAPGGTRVRASTLLFDQPVDRFLSTLPPPAEQSA